MAGRQARGLCVTAAGMCGVWCGDAVLVWRQYLCGGISVACGEIGGREAELSTTPDSANTSGVSPKPARHARTGVECVRTWRSHHVDTAVLRLVRPITTGCHNSTSRLAQRGSATIQRHHAPCTTHAAPCSAPCSVTSGLYEKTLPSVSSSVISCSMLVGSLRCLARRSEAGREGWTEVRGEAKLLLPHLSP
eukprot:365922-Chlamydomonas_euryale.AAC.9